MRKEAQRQQVICPESASPVLVQDLNPDAPGPQARATCAWGLKKEVRLVWDLGLKLSTSRVGRVGHRSVGEGIPQHLINTEPYQAGRKVDNEPSWRGLCGLSQSRAHLNSIFSLLRPVGCPCQQQAAHLC